MPSQRRPESTSAVLYEVTTCNLGLNADTHHSTRLAKRTRYYAHGQDPAVQHCSKINYCLQAEVDHHNDHPQSTSDTLGQS